MSLVQQKGTTKAPKTIEFRYLLIDKCMEEYCQLSGHVPIEDNERPDQNILSFRKLKLLPSKTKSGLMAGFRKRLRGNLARIVFLFWGVRPLVTSSSKSQYEGKICDGC